MRKILFILGTRPEAIKLAPVILAMRETGDLRPVVCNTEQQKQLSNQTLGYFGIEPNYRLDVMTENQSLPGLNAKLLVSLQEIIGKNKFDAVIVQGDTMSVFAGATAAFYSRIPVFHVEAGLRSYDLHEPFPEEALRQMTSRITDLHFAPTENAVASLRNEGVPAAKIRLTTNTVIDALFRIPETTTEGARTNLAAKGIDLAAHPVLVTAHRRENHGERLNRIVVAISMLVEKYPTRQFVIPVHPNPNVKSVVISGLSKYPNVHLSAPLDYPELVEVQRAAHLILTDSGGIQEEAPSFGVPVLVMRYETERQEGVEAGCAKLVGADSEKIVEEAVKILSRSYVETRLDAKKNPYGDGRAAERIIEAIQEYFR